MLFTGAYLSLTGSSAVELLIVTQLSPTESNAGAADA